MSVIFDGLMGILNGEILTASPEGSTMMIDGDEVSVTFDIYHAVVHGEDVSVAQTTAEIVNGEAMAATRSE